MIVHLQPGYDLICEYGCVPNILPKTAMLVYAEPIVGLVLDPANSATKFITEQGFFALDDRLVLGVRGPHSSRIEGPRGAWTSMLSASEHVRKSLVANERPKEK